MNFFSIEGPDSAFSLIFFGIEKLNKEIEKTALSRPDQIIPVADDGKDILDREHPHRKNFGGYMGEFMVSVFFFKDILRTSQQ